MVFCEFAKEPYKLNWLNVSGFYIGKTIAKEVRCMKELLKIFKTNKKVVDKILLI